LTVPTEGASATTSVELEVPAEVTVVEVKGGAGDYRTVKADGRIVSVVWSVQIPPGDSRQLVFVARNPSRSAEIQWKAHQVFADGSRRDWVEPPGAGRQPAPRTRLEPPH
jgi:hypothetical protein